jgi:F-type H+-transporting ATPase subunit c
VPIKTRVSGIHQQLKPTKTTTMITGNIAAGVAVFGAAIAVGLIGFRTVEAVGRNPQAQGKILPLALVLGAFAEGLGILAMILIK